MYESNEEQCEYGTIKFEMGRSATCPGPCEACTPTFSPVPGQRYIVNAWVHEDLPPGSQLTSFPSPELTVRVLDLTGAEIQAQAAVLIGDIIDGWQLMEAELVMSISAAKVKVELSSTGPEVLYDDVRIFPADGSMKSYVYDPENLRFVAELDERHYATFYEYDNEGRLVRVKKETERGIKTLRETRQSGHHRQPPE